MPHTVTWYSVMVRSFQKLVAAVVTIIDFSDILSHNWFKRAYPLAPRSCVLRKHPFQSDKREKLGRRLL